MFTGRKGWARLLGVEALLYALAFVVGTGVIPGWGEWYSNSLHYRRQTDAFFHGELALSHRPVDVEFDQTWSNDGVHQVWGLAVPAWRFPFEVLARLCGQQAFPDRIAFAVALALWAWFVLRTLLPAPSEEESANLAEDAGARGCSAGGATDSSPRREPWVGVVSRISPGGAEDPEFGPLTRSFAPPGLVPVCDPDPRLTPWATFFRRSAALGGLALNSKTGSKNESYFDSTTVAVLSSWGSGSTRCSFPPGQTTVTSSTLPPPKPNVIGSSDCDR